MSGSDRGRHGTPPRADIERQIAELASLYGWAHHRTTPGRTLDGYADGFPSSILLRDGRLLLLTFTTASGKLTPAEQLWVDALEAGPKVEVLLVGPRDLPAIIRVLRDGVDVTPGVSAPEFARPIGDVR